MANSILSAVDGTGHFALLAVLVLLTVLLTQVINGVAAVTILAPIGISAALVVCIAETETAIPGLHRYR